MKSTDSETRCAFSQPPVISS